MTTRIFNLPLTVTDDTVSVPSAALAAAIQALLGSTALTTGTTQGQPSGSTSSSTGTGSSTSSGQNSGSAGGTGTGTGASSAPSGSTTTGASSGTGSASSSGAATSSTSATGSIPASVVHLWVAGDATVEADGTTTLPDRVGGLDMTAAASVGVNLLNGTLTFVSKGGFKSKSLGKLPIGNADSSIVVAGKGMAGTAFHYGLPQRGEWRQVSVGGIGAGGAPFTSLYGLDVGVTDGTWNDQHVVRFDVGDECDWYIDGRETGSKDLSTLNPPLVVNTQGDVAMIGTDALGRNFNGSISWVAVTNGKLTSDDYTKLLAAVTTSAGSGSATTGSTSSSGTGTSASSGQATTGAPSGASTENPSGSTGSGNASTPSSQSGTGASGSSGSATGTSSGSGTGTTGNTGSTSSQGSTTSTSGANGSSSTGAGSSQSTSSTGQGSTTPSGSGTAPTTGSSGSIVKWTDWTDPAQLHDAQTAYLLSKPTDPNAAWIQMTFPYMTPFMTQVNPASYTVPYEDVWTQPDANFRFKGTMGGLTGLALVVDCPDASVPWLFAHDQGDGTWVSDPIDLTKYAHGLHDVFLFGWTKASGGNAAINLQGRLFLNNPGVKPKYDPSLYVPPPAVAANGLVLTGIEDWSGLKIDRNRWQLGVTDQGKQWGSDACFVDDQHFSQEQKDWIYSFPLGLPTLRMRAQYAEKGWVDTMVGWTEIDQPQEGGKFPLRRWFSGFLISSKTGGPPTPGFAVRAPGYIEAFCRKAWGLGTWESFWLNNANHVTEGNSDIELDLDESNGTPFGPKNGFNSTSHFWTTAGQKSATSIQENAGRDLARDWFKLGAYFRPDGNVEIFIDDKSYGTIKNYAMGSGDPTIPENDWFPLMVDFAMGGGWAIQRPPHDWFDFFIGPIRFYNKP